MKMKQIAGLILASAFLAAGPVFAYSRGGSGGGHAVAVSRGGGGFTSGGRGVSRGFSHFSAGRSFRSPGVAFGGSSFNSRAYSNGRGGSGGYSYAFHSHSGWSPGRDYDWHGHHYRWYNNGWFIVDPYYYGDYYPSYYDSYASGYTVYGSADDNGSPDGGSSLSVPAQVQQELARDGYYQGPIDGVIGPVTQAAISAYQHDNGLRVTGTINSHLLDALDLD